MARVKLPPHIGFPHNLGIEERATLEVYGRLVARDPSAASYESVAVARNKAYSTIKNQLDSARRKMGTNTTWGAYLLMMAREKVQTERENKRWQATLAQSTSVKPGPRTSRPEKTGKTETPRQSGRVRAAS
jgi:hypothetical protein